MKEVIEGTISEPNEQELAEYIKKCIKLNEDMVIPYSIDCYEFMCSDDEYREIKMEEGWEIIKGCNK